MTTTTTPTTTTTTTAHDEHEEEDEGATSKQRTSPTTSVDGCSAEADLKPFAVIAMLKPSGNQRGPLASWRVAMHWACDLEKQPTAPCSPSCHPPLALGRHTREASAHCQLRSQQIPSLSVLVCAMLPENALMDRPVRKSHDTLFSICYIRCISAREKPGPEQ